MKFIYCGFDLFFDCLKKLCDMGNECVGIYSCEVDEVFESSKQIFDYARCRDIPFTYNRITTEDIENTDCEFLVSAGYYFKIPVTDKIYQVNIHPSLLPDGRGPWPMPHYFLKNYKECGVSAHIISEGLDEGDILHSVKIDIKPEDNLETLTKTIVNYAVVLVGELFGNFNNYFSNRTPQSNGIYWQEPTVNEMTFTPNTPYETIDVITKAFYGFVCYLKTSGNTVKIKKSYCVKNYDDIPFNVVNYKINGGYLCIIQMA